MLDAGDGVMGPGLFEQGSFIAFCVHLYCAASEVLSISDVQFC